ncbi:MAG: toll/interleukin-1 receptor domain-containing protein, partial [Vitreimonas sp.]
MADVFISYKSERRKAARHLSKVLSCYGYDVWYDYGLIPGNDFEQHLIAELEAAKVVVVLWCSMAVTSEWVQREARYASGRAKYLPCRIERAQLPSDFAGADTIDLTAWDAA